MRQRIYIKMKTYSIILGGGLGARMKASVPKCYFKLDHETILDKTIAIFESSDLVDGIIVVVPGNHETPPKNYKKVLKYIPGGVTRGESMTKAIEAIIDEDANIIIHDGCRPFVKPDIIQQGLSRLADNDIVKTMEKPFGEVFCLPEKKIYTRNEYYILSSPAFTTLAYVKKLLPILKECNCETIAAHKIFKNPRIAYIESNRENIKITFPEDLVLAKYFSLVINK